MVTFEGATECSENSIRMLPRYVVTGLLGEGEVKLQFTPASLFHLLSVRGRSPKVVKVGRHHCPSLSIIVQYHHPSSSFTIHLIVVVSIIHCVHHASPLLEGGSEKGRGFAKGDHHAQVGGTLASDFLRRKGPLIYPKIEHVRMFWNMYSQMTRPTIEPQNDAECTS